MIRKPALTVPFPQSAIRNPLFPLPPSPRLRVAASLLLLLSLFTTIAFAQSPAMVDMLRSQDAAQRKQGMALVFAQIDRDAQKLDAGPVRDWIAALREGKHNAEALQLIDRALPLFQDRDNGMIVRLMAYKAAVSLDIGRKEDAIAFLSDSPHLESAIAIYVVDALQLSKPLLDAGLLTQYLDMIDQVTVIWTDDLNMLERALSLRTKVLLAANQPQQALASAKSLYNVCRMGETAIALGMVAKCLQAANPNDREIMIRFRDEQVVGASQATTQPAAKSAIMAQVKISPTVYEKALGKDLFPTLAEEDFVKLTRMGNLLLLADRPQDAKAWFEQAYRVCDDKQLANATESLARVMKAEDGTIGRANAFLLALRPGKVTAK